MKKFPEDRTIGTTGLEKYSRNVSPALEITSDHGVGLKATAGDGSVAISGNSGEGDGVEGNSNDGSGVVGGSLSGEGVLGLSQIGPGVLASSTEGPGVHAESFDNNAIYAVGTGAVDAIYAESYKGNALHCEAYVGGAAAVVGIGGPSPRPLASAGWFFGKVVVVGDLHVTGIKSAAVAHRDGSHRLLYAIESPENWFEDFGEGRLRNGKAKIALDRDFAALAATDSYYVFLTPRQDTRGLYVRSQNRSGFEVCELQGGKTNAAFVYRVVAKRKDVGARRLEKVKIPAMPQAPERRKHPSPKLRTRQELLRARAKR